MRRIGGIGLHRACVFLAGIACSVALNGQSDQYTILIKEAQAAYSAQRYAESAHRYNEAFRLRGGSGDRADHYDAACSWALAAQPDSAFHQLWAAARMGLRNLRHLKTDADLIALHHDARWPTLVAEVQANKEHAEPHVNRTLSRLLDSVITVDQGMRAQIKHIEQRYGRDSKELQAHYQATWISDSLNVLLVTAILDRHGWLGPDSVGEDGANALFLVVQHAPIETQQRYLPMMREAVAAGRAKGAHLAMLEDRVRIRTGQRQLYGSQIGTFHDTGEHYVMPLEDPLNVDARRLEVGLGPFAAYVSRWGMVWDAAAYARALPELEQRIKAQE